MPRVGLNPAKVVAAAADLADEVGVDNLTLAELAKRLGVALPSLYKHIRGLDGLRRDLAMLGMTELGNLLTGASIGRSGTDALVAVSHAYRTFAEQRPGLYSATIRAPSPDDEEHTRAAASTLGVAVAIMASYGIEGSSAIHAIRIYRAAMHGFVTQEASGAWAMDESIDESFELMIRLLDRAFTNWSTIT